MANNCWYQMRIAGQKESVDQFIDMLSGKGPVHLGVYFPPIRTSRSHLIRAIGA